MTIRQRHLKDFSRLNQDWAWDQADWQRGAQQRAMQAIQEGRQEFWVVESGDELIGELHIAWEKADHDEANGKNRAYLFALRIHPDHQRQGLGTQLMERALQSIRQKGYTEATIGAYADEPHLRHLYQKWGFTQFVKEVLESNEVYSKVYELFLQEL